MMPTFRFGGDICFLRGERKQCAPQSSIMTVLVACVARQNAQCSDVRCAGRTTGKRQGIAMTSFISRRICTAIMLAAAAMPAAGQSDNEAKDMALVGRHDLQARSAYQPVVREQNGR